jgi:hypothetical protein
MSKLVDYLRLVKQRQDIKQANERIMSMILTLREQSEPELLARLSFNKEIIDRLDKMIREHEADGIINNEVRRIEQDLGL